MIFIFYGQKLKTITYRLEKNITIPVTVVYLPTHFILELQTHYQKKIFKILLTSVFLKKNSKKNTKAYQQQFNKKNLFSLQKISSCVITNKELNNYLSNAQQNNNLINFYLKNIIPFNYQGKKIDLQGKTIGKGFAGTIKRYGFKRGPVSHGSKNIRLPGSIGAGTTPGRVFKNKKMAGHLGNQNRTIKNIDILKKEGNLLFLKGTFPGKPKTFYLLKLY